MWKIIHDYVGLWDFCLIVCVCVFDSLQVLFIPVQNGSCTDFFVHFLIYILKSILCCDV